MPSNEMQIPFQRIDTPNFGRITTSIINPQYDAKGNYASAQVRLYNRLWPVVLTDQWDEDRWVWKLELSGADLVQYHLLSQPTPKRQQEEW